MTKDECEKRAKDNWHLAHEFEKSNKKQLAQEARERAIEAEKDRDSWLYRTFGW